MTERNNPRKKLSTMLTERKCLIIYMFLIDDDVDQIVVSGASALGLFLATAWRSSDPKLGGYRNDYPGGDGGGGGGRQEKE